MPRKDSREKILKAAMDAISERGMFALRMQDVGERVGMSPGHILYYYRSKQRLLLETLRWSEDRLAEPRARGTRGLGDGQGPPGALHRHLPADECHSSRVAALVTSLGIERGGSRGRQHHRCPQRTLG